MKLMVCTMQRHAPNPHSCGNGGGLEIAASLAQAICDHRLPVQLERVACLGACLKGPNVQLLPEGRNWHAVGPEDVDQVIAYLLECSGSKAQTLNEI